ncbi:hypothetical protein D9M73_114000 [compost metagenome]
MRRADMLEHADRHDPVERALHLAIIDQLEGDHVRHARRRRALPRHLQLFFRKRHAQYLGTRHLVQVQRHATPAATDVEHGHAGLQREFGRDMRFLVVLRLFQAVGRIGKIGAAILAVGVEEEIVQPVRQIIMVRNIALRSARHVDAADAMRHRLDHAAQR